MIQAFGAYVRRQGQRLWQLNYYRMKLNAYNRVAFRDAYKEGTMQFTHSGLEFMPFLIQWGVSAAFQDLHAAGEKWKPRRNTQAFSALVFPQISVSIFHPNVAMFSDSLYHTSHVEFPRSLILKHRWEAMHFIKFEHLCLERLGKCPIHGFKWHSKLENWPFKEVDWLKTQERNKWNAKKREIFMANTWEKW